MILNDGTKISVDQIEELNAHGPYTMAQWKSGEVVVGNEEGLSGRSEYFIKLIRDSILNNFSMDQIEKFSILDIGSFDGWVLHQLSDLPFAKMVGIEPRQKNIDKGMLVRKTLKLENSAEYRTGSIESLGDEVFDIVICAGVLYHVESIPLALQKIKDSCRRMVFIESRCLSSKYITEELKYEIEMRDLIYQFEDEICGITAQKYESSYHDGSAAKTTIVNVPSTESLIMNLNVLGFENIDVVVDNDTYRADVWEEKRPLGGVCITAMLPQESKNITSEEDSWIYEYERGLESQIFPREFLEPFYKKFCLNQEGVGFSESLNHICEYLTSPIFDENKVKLDWLPKNCNNQYALEIVKNWFYRPNQKIALEYGKLLNNEGQFDEAVNVLKSITTELNADWRSVYRSFHVMSRIYAQTNNQDMALHYRNLCLKANHKYPVIDE